MGLWASLVGSFALLGFREGPASVFSASELVDALPNNNVAVILYRSWTRRSKEYSFSHDDGNRQNRRFQHKFASKYTFSRINRQKVQIAWSSSATCARSSCQKYKVIDTISRICQRDNNFYRTLFFARRSPLSVPDRAQTWHDRPLNAEIVLCRKDGGTWPLAVMALFNDKQCVYRKRGRRGRFRSVATRKKVRVVLLRKVKS